jgi:hypothetical protein
MWPSALEITAGDFAFAAGHRRTAISLLAGTLNPSWPQILTREDGRLNTVRW